MKILICDDHTIIRDGLRQILKPMDGVTAIREAADGDQVISMLKAEAFDILVLDISLPGRSGLEVLQTVKEKWPSTNVLILSMHPQEQYALRALKLGASGYLTKETASEELQVAVKEVSQGRKYISHSLAESLTLLLTGNSNRQKHDELSVREFEIMIKLADGKSNKEIGSELFISDKTVGAHRSHIMEKMGIVSNAGLTKYCIENGLISPCSQ
jgi:DNA-binding NarL/FixJ family response regulator